MDSQGLLWLHLLWTYHVKISKPQRTAVLATVSANKLLILLSLLMKPLLRLLISTDFGS
jgi:hypothetical protein